MIKLMLVRCHASLTRRVQVWHVWVGTLTIVPASWEHNADMNVTDDQFSYKKHCSIIRRGAIALDTQGGWFFWWCLPQK